MIARFLTNVFPFGEKSGLNVSNRFNEHPAPQLASKEELKSALATTPFVLLFGCYRAEPNTDSIRCISTSNSGSFSRFYVIAIT